MSLGFAILILFLIFLFICFVFYLSIRIPKDDRSERDKLAELFDGLKLNMTSRRQSVHFLVKRTIFVSVLIVVVPNSTQNLIWTLFGLQLLHLSYSIVVRPYIEVKVNVVQIVNEIYFLILMSWLFYFNSESRWTEFITYHNLI